MRLLAGCDRSCPFRLPVLLPKSLFIIHEWGTFTSLQDESGRSIGGVNVDDEPVPDFVHRFGPSSLQAANDRLSQGYHWGHPDVTMRLETPVMYFYPPDDKPITLDVSATFNGGLLTEFYPNAQTTYDGKPSTKPPDGINANTRGGLEWHGVSIHKLPPPIISCAPAPAAYSAGQPPATDSHVWLAPRNVNSMPVTVGKEAEQYLFYRGVGHRDAPVRVTRTGDRIMLFDQGVGLADWPGIWLADFRADGSCAFRAIKAAPSLVNDGGASIPATFANGDYAIENVDKLKEAMQQALVKAGLFEDEASAMLETWKLSYFKSNGERLFFLVPRVWTDSVLPLSISQKCELTRVMMGRIELVTPEQRAAAKQLVAWDRKPSPDSISGELRSKLADSLGRFSHAIVEDESRREAAAPAPVDAKTR